MSSPLSRRRLLALTGGSIASASILVACGGSEKSIDSEEFGKGDVGILNFLLAFDRAELAYYRALAEQKTLNKSAAKTVAKFAGQEQEHVGLLEEQIHALGAKPSPKQKLEFSFEDEKSALEMGSELESATAGAYLGNLLQLKNEPALVTALEIHVVEGRHASTIAYLLNHPTTPDGAFAKGQSEDEALGTLEGFVSD